MALQTSLQVHGTKQLRRRPLQVSFLSIPLDFRFRALMGCSPQLPLAAIAVLEMSSSSTAASML